MREGQKQPQDDAEVVESWGLPDGCGI